MSSQQEAFKAKFVTKQIFSLVWWQSCIKFKSLKKWLIRKSWYIHAYLQWHECIAIIIKSHSFLNKWTVIILIHWVILRGSLLTVSTKMGTCRKCIFLSHIQFLISEYFTIQKHWSNFLLVRFLAPSSVKSVLSSQVVRSVGNLHYYYVPNNAAPNVGNKAL